MSAPDLYKQVTILHGDGRHDVVWVPMSRSRVTRSSNFPLTNFLNPG